MLFLSVAFTSLLSTCLAKIYTNPSQLPFAAYDYVVVGGGTAGLVIANRLTENAQTQVLVLEAGPSHEGQVGTQIPLLCAGLIGGPLDWGYTTTAQSGLDGTSIVYPRGKVLGGSSSINFMVYTRPTAADWDRWAGYTGSSDWSFSKIKPYITKHESFVSTNAAGKINPTQHGSSGPIKTTISGFSLPLDAKVFAAIQEPAIKAAGFQFNLDTNSGNPLGVGWLQATIADGERQSSATGYLAPKYLARSNLHVLVGAHANSVLASDSRASSKIDTVTYQMLSDSNTVLKVQARKEIILSAGSLNTPKLLLLSGIGPKEDLKALGIPVVIDSPNVGKGLEDHPRLANVFTVNISNLTANQGFVGNDDLFRNPTAEIAKWSATKQGPLGNPPANQLGWFRIPAASSIYKKFTDPSPGKTSPHYELLFSPSHLSTNFPQPAIGNFMSITISYLTPVARGFVKLASKNPLASPIVNPNVLGSEFDLFVMKEAVKNSLLFVKAKALQGYVTGPLGPLVGVDGDDAKLTAYVKAQTGTTWHPTGTAAMSPCGSTDGVVDPDLKVKGLEGLRIIDASIFPFIPSAHPMAGLYIIAERAADYIKADNQ